VISALVTIGSQVADSLYRTGVIGAGIWYALAILYFAVYGRKTLVFSPGEEFVVKHREATAST
jgi:ethanolamine permease